MASTATDLTEKFEDDFDTGPSNPSWWTVFIKGLLGLITGIAISFIIFVMLILVGGVIEEAVNTQVLGGTAINPLLPLILVIIAFLGTFLGTISLAFAYNMLYPEKYYDMGKMFSLIFFTNVITFLFFLALYVLFAGSIGDLFFVLAFHIMITVFITFSLVEISSNPNYAAVHLLGGAIGLVLAVILFSVFYKTTEVSVGRTAQIMLALPPVLIYAMLPFWHGLREKIYYRLYINGANFFYIPSLSEVMVDEESSEDVEVDFDMD